MTIKSILVHVDDTVACQRRLRVAVEIARRFDADLAGLYFPPASVPVDLAAVPPPEIAMRPSQGEMRARAEDALLNAVQSAHVRGGEMRIVEGHPVRRAIAEMRCADLSVLSQGNANGDARGFERDLAEQALLANGAPVVFVPHAPASSSVGQRIVIAWDGGREAGRAVRDALPLLSLAKRVTVLSLGSRAQLGDDLSRSQARLAAYLQLHGVESFSRNMECAANEVGGLLLSQLADLDADLLVMGAYGHARIREIVLGGVTRTILDSMTVPVLMSH
jgi:nucleotide-binding universal stress UspA family protein